MGLLRDFELYESISFNTALGLIKNEYGHAEHFTEQYLIGYKISGVTHNLPDIPTGIVNEPIIHQVHVYPNPAAEYISINANGGAKPLAIKIYNVHGALVFDNNYVDGKVDISGLKDGLYYMVIQDGIKMMSATFIKE